MENKIENRIENREDYIVITELPSHFRYYNTDKVLIRGLYLGEVEALSKFVDGNLLEELEQICNIYKEAIKEIDIYDLEFTDFLTILSLIGLLTSEEFDGGEFTVNCINLVPNYKKEEILKKIDELEQKAQNAQTKEEIDKYSTEAEKLYNELIELPQFVECGTEIRKTINIDDFEFEEPYKEFKEIEGFKLKPLLVKDVIEIEKHKDKNKDILILSGHIEGNLLENYEKLSKLKMSTAKKIIEEVDRLSINVKPIIFKCPRCGFENKLYITLNDIKVLP